MHSDRLQRQIDRLLDEGEEAIRRLDWATVAERAEAVLALQADHADAAAYLTAAREKLATPAAGQASGARLVPPVVPLSAPPSEPTSFANGRYEVKRFLGEGGKKRVYLAHDTLLDRDVAFALIKTEGLDNVGRERVRREAQAMGRLGAHPHIVSVFDLGEHEGQPYMVTELMGGGDVEGLVEKAEGHRLPLDQAVRLADEVCRGLEFAHSHEIVHRDLKPGNVWLTAEGTAKIGDFGLAVAVDKTRLTQAGLMVGTVSYMPPEQATGGEVTPRSDLYSLGAMLYELVCGRPPFVGDESVAIISQHLNTPPVAPSWHRPDCPLGLEALILRLLEKDPAKRFTSANEVRGALAAGAWGAPDRAPALPVATPSASPAGPLYRGGTFVGREAELRQLQGAFDTAISGQGGLAAVVGEPGIGKTALCEQLATCVALRGGKTLVGHCYEEGSLSLPYLAFVEALRTYVLSRDPDDLKRDLGSAAGDVARIVSEIRERADVEPRPPGGDPEEDRWRLYQAVTTFLRSAATVQPILLVLEDLHWADRGTLDLLLHLARNLAGSRLLVVGTYRDVEVDRSHPLSGTLAELRRSTSFQRIPLRGLTVEEVHRMMNIIRGQEVPWSRAEAIHRQTEGNPLFVQEVLRYLVEEGLVVREGGRYVRTDGSDPEAGIPEGLRDVIGKRLSRLSERTNQVLATAAVIGREFRLDILQGVAALPEDELYAALEEATERAVVEQRAAVGAMGFRFTHAFFRQTLYDEIFAPRRIRLHQQVGRALESIHARRLEEHAAEMADHFAQSTEREDLEKALHYSELAANRSVAVYAYGESARHLERALQVQDVLDPDDRAKRCDLLLALAHALMAVGEPQRVAEVLAPEALELAEGLGDSGRASAACRLALTALERYGGASVWVSPEYRRWAERADRYAPPDTLDRVHAEVALFLSRTIRDRDREHADRALELARLLGTPPALFEGTRPALQPNAPLGEDERYRAGKEIAAAGRAGVDLFTLARGLYFSGVALFNHGDRDGAEAMWSELDELGTRTRDTYVLLRGPFLATVRATLDGNLEEALSNATGLRERAEELGSAAFGRFWGSALTLRPLLYLGRGEEAIREQPPGPQSVARGLLGLAHVGRTEECASGLEQFMHDAAGLWGEELMMALEAAILLGHTPYAAQLSDRLITMLPTDFIGNPEHSCTSLGRLLAGAALLVDHIEEASASCRQALAVCQRARFRPEVALLHLQLAEVLMARARDPGDAEPAHLNDEVQAHLDVAIEEFRAMKMQPALERALRHKGILKA